MWQAGSKPYSVSGTTVGLAVGDTASKKVADCWGGLVKEGRSRSWSPRPTRRASASSGTAARRTTGSGRWSPAAPAWSGIGTGTPCTSAPRRTGVASDLFRARLAWRRVPTGRRPGRRPHPGRRCRGAVLGAQPVDHPEVSGAVASRRDWSWDPRPVTVPVECRDVLTGKPVPAGQRRPGTCTSWSSRPSAPVASPPGLSGLIVDISPNRGRIGYSTDRRRRPSGNRRWTLPGELIGSNRSVPPGGSAHRMILCRISPDSPLYCRSLARQSARSPANPIIPARGN